MQRSDWMRSPKRRSWGPDLSWQATIWRSGEQAIKSGKTPNLDRPLREGTEINLRLPALIPDQYLPDVHNRLILYKRIANAESDEQLRELQVEMIDRFGLLPDPTRTLFLLTSIKIRAEALGISKIDAGSTGGRVEFSETPPIDPLAIVRLVQSEPHRYRLTGANQLRFEEVMDTPERRFDKTLRLLDRLQSVHDNGVTDGPRTRPTQFDGRH